MLMNSTKQERRSRNKPTVQRVIEDTTPPSDDPSTGMPLICLICDNVNNFGAVPSQSEDNATDEQKIARNVQALKNRLRGRGGRRAIGRGGTQRFDSGSGRDSHPGSESVSFIVPLSFEHCLTHLSDSSDAPAVAKKKTKVGRKWGNEVPTEGDMAVLDYSSDKPDGNNSTSQIDVSALVDRASFGTRTVDGMYEVKDWEFGDKGKGGDGMDELISQALDSVSLKEKGQPSTGTFGSSLGSLFARLTGSKTLTEEDLKPVLEGMKQHLMKKNVAKEIAEKVCEGVGESLVGRKVGGFQSTS